MSGPFRNRTLLRSRDLTHADHVLARLDAQHVAVVHREHGVVAGLALHASDDGRSLFVNPGAAYSPCGEFVCVPHQKALAPPPRRGLYTVWLNTNGQVHARSVAAGRTSDAIRLGEAEVVHEGAPTVWRPPAPGRREVRRPNPPYVAAGSTTIGQDDVVFQPRAFDGPQGDPLRRLSVTVDTSGGRFEQTPIYFATVGAIERGGRSTGSPISGIDGWFATITNPRTSRFTLEAHVHVQVFKVWEKFSSDYPSISADVSWIGVLPRRAHAAAHPSSA